ncbi:MAG: DNA repair protein RecN [Candidatus Coatesbacteria bacterium RBG_13_66_14]|uniref:DNA repair protein RecN n=1 Tax=Candidatus Coatesbacteria bacterium RBG_13_66_14 TaxID=1817816 RepID=A0A1F5FJL3_9BACT|nr:MAG: DNA repair protein RecN [Candidatus Coatesbacteria bacterium RBG_13_66_14]
MLSYLAVRDLATISNLEVELDRGLCAITGATGAGKSVLVGAIGLALGERAKADAVRSGAQAAEVQAIFRDVRLTGELAEELGIEPAQEELVIRRRVDAGGRSRCWLGGNLVPVSTLAGLGDLLVDLHGQHEHQTLLQAQAQLELLDAFDDLEGLRGKVTHCFEAVRAAEAALAELEESAAAGERQLELWRHELKEIDDADLDPGEEESLLGERQRLRAVVELSRLAQDALQLLGEGESSALDGVEAARGTLRELVKLDPEQGPLEEELTQLRFSLVDIVERLRVYGERLEADPARLEEIETRLALLEHLKRKFGPNLTGVLEYREWAARRLADHEDRGTALVQRREILEGAREEYLWAAREISQKRREAVNRLTPRVNQILKRLGFPEDSFAVEMGNRPGDDGWSGARATSTGLDSVEFQLAANPGEPPRPLAKVASGGEISRVMLALKGVTGERYGVPTMVFDEVDAGIGGHIAGVVAELLQDLGRSRQVVVITHLPQIAADADAHYRVKKDSAEGRTFTDVERVEGEERVGELSAMLGGGESAVEHARELLKR